MPHPDNQPVSKVPSELPSYSLHDEAEPTGWRVWLRGRRLVILLVLAVCVIAGAVGAKPAYRELKARRALAITNSAGEALDRGDAAEASALLRQAALMAFNDERVATRVTFHAARAGDMASVAEIGKKIGEGAATPEEILVFGERSLASGRGDDVLLALRSLPADLPPEETVQRGALQAGLLVSRSEQSEAQAVLRQTLAAVPGSEADSIRVMLANLLLSRGESSGTDEARQLLEQAARGDGSDAVAALRVLAMSHAGLAREAQQQLDDAVARLRQHPKATTEDEIFIARLLVSSNPDRRAEAVANLVSRLRSLEAALDERVAAARWLVGLQAHEAVLDLVAPEEVATHAGALMVRLDALSGLNRWDECSELIEANRDGALPDVLYHLFRARIAGTKNNSAEEDAEKRQLRQVMQFAELPHVLFAARYAETVGWKPEAFAAWRILASDSGAKPDALRGQIRNLPPTATAADGLALAEELLALQPQDPSARLSAAFFALLVGRNIDQASATAEEFLVADPESVDIRRVVALARLRTDQAASGLEIMPADNGEPRWQTLHAALLHATGQTNAAEKLTSTIDTSNITPEERDLLAK